VKEGHKERERERNRERRAGGRSDQHQARRGPGGGKTRMVVFNQECLDEIEELRQKKGKPTMSWSEVGQHKTKGDCYFVVDSCVFDVTDYMRRHPGGETAIMRHAGKDATTFFNRVGSHTSSARKSLARLYVADIQTMSGMLMGGIGGGSSSKGKKKSKGGDAKKNPCSCVLS